MAGDGKKEVLQLVYGSNAYTRKGGMSGAQSICGEFKIQMSIVVAEDPFVAHKIPETAFLQDLRGKGYGGYILEINFFHEFDYFRGIGIFVEAPCIGNFSADVDLCIVNKCVGEYLLDGNDLTFAIEYLIAQP